MPRGRADYQKPGTWNVRCSMCFAKRKADELVKNWRGQYRCKEHDEPRHPQDFLKAIPDNPSVPYVQDPDQIEVFNPLLTSFSGPGSSGPVAEDNMILTSDNQPILVD